MILHLETQLLRREKMGNLRKLPPCQALVDFSSNDYLGLARSSQLEWSGRIGSTGSRLLNGNSIYAVELEDRISQFHGYEAGLLFNCGYMANVGLLSILAGTILFDAQVHASTRDGIALSHAKAFPFRHNDLEHLERRLQSCAGERFICVESIYSTDGSIAPLSEICHLAKQYGAEVIVDEAHATGVMGPQGRGLVAEYGLVKEVFAQVVTFGKGLGAYGAIVLGKDTLKASLINFATSFIYTTAPPIQVLAAIKCSYDLFPTMEKERAHLKRLIQISGSKSHILSVPIPGNAEVKKAAQTFMEHGFDVRPLLSPTVQRGQEALRICLHSFNTEKELLQCKELLSLG